MEAARYWLTFRKGEPGEEKYQVQEGWLFKGERYQSMFVS